MTSRLADPPNVAGEDSVSHQQEGEGDLPLLEEEHMTMI